MIKLIMSLVWIFILPIVLTSLLAVTYYLYAPPTNPQEKINLKKIVTVDKEKIKLNDDSDVNLNQNTYQIEEQNYVNYVNKSKEDSEGKVLSSNSKLQVEDSRPIIISNFLKRYDSPLKPYDYFGQKLVEIADRHEIDFRLLPAIAMQESNLCKKIPEGSYNCLGFGIHERGTLHFESFEANFERAAKELKANYIDPGRITPEQIMKKYTPSSDGSWANSVNQWMTEMRYDDREQGLEKKASSNVLEFAKKTSTVEE